MCIRDRVSTQSTGVWLENMVFSLTDAMASAMPTKSCALEISFSGMGAGGGAAGSGGWDGKGQASMIKFGADSGGGGGGGGAGTGGFQGVICADAKAASQMITQGMQKSLQ
eukprot:TRINITY_DN17167_c0_g1_i1.p2 TRINITY_DN17167_c0_g1~~TRINITY_DN17167_c0_g1_i1.p2  ORF type:complete len:111 (-),score=27.15 TRINITY_DN17167_c0_g1_i1:299-631(-)